MQIEFTTMLLRTILSDNFNNFLPAGLKDKLQGIFCWPASFAAQHCKVPYSCNVSVRYLSVDFNPFQVTNS